MSERTSYAPGTPCWVDLGHPDIDAAAASTAACSAGSCPERRELEQTGGYRQATLRGKDVAGMMPLMQEGQPPAWSTYVSVEDADATAAAVTRGRRQRDRRADGRDGPRPMASSPTRPAPSSASGSPARSPAPSLVNEPGALAWNELNTRDLGAAKAFYGAVFGWSFEEHDMGEIGHLHEWSSSATTRSAA